jgi:hypothetical protein
MAQWILVWFFPLVTLSFNVIKKNGIREEFMVEGAHWQVQVGEAATNGLVDDMGSIKSGDIADDDKLGEVVTDSHSSGMPPLARSIFAVAERHCRTALLVHAGGNKYDPIHIIGQIPSSTSSN